MATKCPQEFIITTSISTNAIEARRLELHRLSHTSGKMRDHLGQSEQLEMADQEDAYGTDGLGSSRQIGPCSQSQIAQAIDPSAKREQEKAGAVSSSNASAGATAVGSVKSSISSRACGGASGQASPIDSSTSAIATTAAQAEMPGGGFRRAMSKARSRACGSALSAEIEKYPRFRIAALAKPLAPHKRRRRTNTEVAAAKAARRRPKTVRATRAIKL